jgi:hypothetical protein
MALRNLGKMEIAVRSYFAISLLGLILGIFASGCSVKQEPQTQIKNNEVLGNLKSTQNIGCMSVTKLVNTYTPPDLYNGMVECAREGKYSEGVYLFALAGTYTAYDRSRVFDRASHQAHTVLPKNALNAIEEPNKSEFWKEIKNTLGNAKELLPVCQEITRIGAPNYHPQYMIQQGMGATLSKNKTDGLVSNFDSAKAWKQALLSYLNCP